MHTCCRTPRTEADLEGTSMNRLDMVEAGRAALPFQLTTAQERVLGQVGCPCQGQGVPCPGLAATARAYNLSWQPAWHCRCMCGFTCHCLLGVLSAVCELAWQCRRMHQLVWPASLVAVGCTQTHLSGSTLAVCCQCQLNFMLPNERQMSLQLRPWSATVSVQPAWNCT